MLLSDFFAEQYLPNRLRSGSPNTTRLYAISIRSFSRTLGHAATLADMTNDYLNKHLLRLRESGRAAATINKERSQLLAIWRYAYHRGFVSVWPDVMPEKEPARVPRAWMADEVQRLFAAVDRLDGQIGTADRSLWWRCLLMTCLDTGERIGAVLAARWDWLEGNWLNVPAEVRKGGRSDRQYLLGSGTVRQLFRLKSQQIGDKMFAWPYCDLYLWQSFGRILESAGLPHGRRDKFHRLRRTCASVVHAAGLDATEALDHTHRRTTQAYLDPRFKRKDQPAKILEEWLKKPPNRKNGRKRA